eukprot:360406-Chlamydomonas_euryale.AAC.2
MDTDACVRVWQGNHSVCVCGDDHDATCYSRAQCLPRPHALCSTHPPPHMLCGTHPQPRLLCSMHAPPHELFSTHPRLSACARCGMHACNPQHMPWPSNVDALRNGSQNQQASWAATALNQLRCFTTIPGLSPTPPRNGAALVQGALRQHGSRVKAAVLVPPSHSDGTPGPT